MPNTYATANVEDIEDIIDQSTVCASANTDFISILLLMLIKTMLNIICQ